MWAEPLGACCTPGVFCHNFRLHAPHVSSSLWMLQSAAAAAAPSLKASYSSQDGLHQASALVTSLKSPPGSSPPLANTSEAMSNSLGGVTSMIERVGDCQRMAGPLPRTAVERRTPPIARRAQPSTLPCSPSAPCGRAETSSSSRLPPGTTPKRSRATRGSAASALRSSWRSAASSVDWPLTTPANPTCAPPFLSAPAFPL